MAWEATDETVAVGGAGPGGWSEEQPTTWWDRAKGVAQTTDDAMRAAANAVSFGMADRLAGYMGGEGTDAEVKKSETARERSPYASVAGDVAGAVALPGIGGRQLAARYGSGLGARALGYGAEGAVIGGAQGAGNTYTGNVGDYVSNAAKGATMGGILGAAGGAAFGPRPPVTTARTPSTPRLELEKNADYANLRNSGARYEPAPFAQRADDLEAQLRAERFGPRDHPGAWRALEEMRGGGGAQTAHLGANAIIDPGNIDWIHKGLNRIPQTAERAGDREAAGIIKRSMNDFMENPPPGAVLAGTEPQAALAAALTARARGNNAAFRRGQKMDEMIANAGDKAGANFSGLNLENELRKPVAAYIKQTKGQSAASKAGHSPEEIEAMRRFSRGSGLTNLLRGTSATLGGGSGLGFTTALGVYGGGGLMASHYKDDPDMLGAIGLTAPFLGLGLRRWGNARANASIERMADTIRQRSPLYADRVAAAPMTTPSRLRGQAVQSGRDALALELQKQGPLRITVTPKERDEEEY
jgi:hypothetical protein